MFFLEIEILMYAIDELIEVFCEFSLENEIEANEETWVNNLELDTQEHLCLRPELWEKYDFIYFDVIMLDNICSWIICWTIYALSAHKLIISRAHHNHHRIKIRNFMIVFPEKFLLAWNLPQKIASSTFQSSSCFLLFSKQLKAKVRLGETQFRMSSRD